MAVLNTRHGMVVPGASREPMRRRIEARGAPKCSLLAVFSLIKSSHLSGWSVENILYMGDSFRWQSDRTSFGQLFDLLTLMLSSAALS